MGAQRCPNCKKGFLLKKSKRRRRCNFCGYIKYTSPLGHGRDLPVPKERKKKEEEIPSIGKRRNIPIGEGFQSESYKEQRWIREQQLRLLRKQESIARMLKELRQDKYNKIKRVNIEGELWDVETGKLVREKEKTEKKEEKKVEFEPEEQIEEMLFGKEDEEEGERKNK